MLLDLGEVRGFDYYSGTYFEAYVAGFGAAIAGGGRYDDMLGRFGYDCAAVGFAFDVGARAVGHGGAGRRGDAAGPRLLHHRLHAATRRWRCRWPAGCATSGASVARDIISRGLDESVAYARAQRVRHVLVVGSPRARAGEVLAMSLADGSERVLPVG